MAKLFAIYQQPTSAIFNVSPGEAPSVAREGYDAVMNGDSVVVNGRIYRMLIWLTGVLPRRVSHWISGGAGRRYRKT